MVKAYVLVVANPGSTKTVYAAIRSVHGVVECHEVMGPYDIVVEIEVENLSDVPAILSEQIRTIDGVESTTSLVTFND
jgi:DNA-binding Lrp family transcriptional regulator